MGRMYRNKETDSNVFIFSNAHDGNELRANSVQLSAVVRRHYRHNSYASGFVLFPARWSYKQVMSL